MKDNTGRTRDVFDRPAYYRICVLGRIGGGWADRLAGMAITLADRPCGESVGHWPDISDLRPPHPPVTVLEGELADQAALAGVLNSLYGLHLPVLSVQRLPSLIPSERSDERR